MCVCLCDTFANLKIVTVSTRSNAEEQLQPSHQSDKRKLELQPERAPQARPSAVLAKGGEAHSEDAATGGPHLMTTIGT